MLKRNRIFPFVLVALSMLFAVHATPIATLANSGAANSMAVQESQMELSENLIKDQLGEGLSEREVIAAEVVTEEFARQISAVEWLAPLAPVALSPFFGITLLSGLACYGPEWLPDNALLSSGSPLANPNMFWAFLVLTVITSAPRFSKVSKPIAQVADFLETYSAIVILLTLKVMSMEQFQVIQETPDAVSAGIAAVSWEGLMMLAMAINIVVVNSVKFFFEILVWITPIPFLDACFETANKSLCAGLMAIYAMSPLAALAINILLFVSCALAFTWIRRREVFFRTMLIDWVMQKFSKSAKKFQEQLVVFPKSGIGAIPARAKCLLEKDSDGWKLTHRRLLRAHQVEIITGNAELDKGWWTNAMVLEDGARLTFSNRYADQMESVSSVLELPLVKDSEGTDLQAGRQIEFA
jgi:hypothetical protein